MLISGCCSSDSLAFVTHLTTSIRIRVTFSACVRITPTSSFHCLLIPFLVAFVFPFDDRVLVVVLGVTVASIISAIHALALKASVVLLYLQTAPIIQLGSLPL